jgi:intraflagellar transport protein 80
MYAAQTEQWKAHEGTVLAVSWCAVTNTIVSGGEDCRYRVWDHLGRVLYSSVPHEHPVTAVQWAPSGSYFAAAGFGFLRLCDAAGTLSGRAGAVPDLPLWPWSPPRPI